MSSVERYEEEIRRVAAPSIKDLNLCNKSFNGDTRNNKINAGIGLNKSRSVSSIGVQPWGNTSNNVSYPIRIDPKPKGSFVQSIFYYFLASF